MKKQKVELVDWEDVRQDMKYPVEDTNQGLVFGVYYLDGGEVSDAEWFATEEERNEAIKDCKVI